MGGAAGGRCAGARARSGELAQVAEYIHAHAYPVDTREQHRQTRPQPRQRGEARPPRAAPRKERRERCRGADQAERDPSEDAAQDAAGADVVELRETKRAREASRAAYTSRSTGRRAEGWGCRAVLAGPGAGVRWRGARRAEGRLSSYAEPGVKNVCFARAKNMARWAEGVGSSGSGGVEGGFGEIWTGTAIARSAACTRAARG